MAETRVTSIAAKVLATPVSEARVAADVLAPGSSEARGLARSRSTRGVGRRGAGRAHLVAQRPHGISALLGTRNQVVWVFLSALLTFFGRLVAVVSPDVV
jgi:hypothetical protein